MRQVAMRRDICGLQADRSAQARFRVDEIALDGAGHRQIDPSIGKARLNGKEATVKRLRKVAATLPHPKIGKIVKRLEMIRPDGKQIRIGLLRAGELARFIEPYGEIVARVGVQRIKGQGLAPSPDGGGETTLLLAEDAMRVKTLCLRPMIVGPGQFLLLPALRTWII
jgi:hypothetical protein